jgi:hypothetical protein
VAYTLHFQWFISITFALILSALYLGRRIIHIWVIKYYHCRAIGTVSFLVQQVLFIYLIIVWKNLSSEIWKSFKDRDESLQQLQGNIYYFKNVDLSKTICIVRPIVGILKRVIMCVIIFTLGDHKLTMYAITLTIIFLDFLYILIAQKYLNRWYRLSMLHIGSMSCKSFVNSVFCQSLQVRSLNTTFSGVWIQKEFIDCGTIRD